MVIPLIGAAIIGLLIGIMFGRAGRSAPASDVSQQDYDELSQQLEAKQSEADGFKARAAEFRALLSKRDAMVAERDNYLAELEGRLRAAEAEMLSLRMAVAGEQPQVRRQAAPRPRMSEEARALADRTPTGQMEVIDLRRQAHAPSAIEGDEFADVTVGSGATGTLEGASTGGGGPSVVRRRRGRPIEDSPVDDLMGTAGEMAEADDLLDGVSETAAPPMPRPAPGSDLGRPSRRPSEAGRREPAPEAGPQPVRRRRPQSGGAGSAPTDSAAGGPSAPVTGAPASIAGGDSSLMSRSADPAAGSVGTVAAEPEAAEMDGSADVTQQLLRRRGSRPRPAEYAAAVAAEPATSADTAAEADADATLNWPPADSVDAVDGEQAFAGEAVATPDVTPEASSNGVNGSSAIPDDLLAIAGIGPALGKELNARGIYTFRQLALLTQEQQDDLNDNLGRFRGRLTREDWVGQARRLHERVHGERL